MPDSHHDARKTDRCATEAAPREVRAERGGRPAAPRTTHSLRRLLAPLAAMVFTLLLAGTLTGCGVVAAVIPEIGVGDPLGVDGQEFTTQLAAGGLEAQAQSHQTMHRNLNVRDTDMDLRGFSLARFHANVGLQPEVRLSAPLGAEYPAEFTVTEVRVSASLSDENDAVALQMNRELALTFAKGACDATSCAYRYDGAESLKDALDITVDDKTKLKSLVAVLRLADRETLNEGTFSLAVEVDSDPSLAGFQVTFGLTSEGSKIKLGG